MHISTSNEKLGVIPSINLPTCVCGNAPCRGKGCYACKGHWLYPNVQKSLEENLTEFVTDSDKFFDNVIKAVNGGLVIYKYFRWFASGDIVNEKFLNGMVKVATKCKQTKFLCFTKKFSIVNNYIHNGGTIPQNLKIVFSGWDKNFEIVNPFNFPVAYIDFKDKTKNPEIPFLSFPCNGDCSTCLACWKLKPGQSVKFNQH